MSLNQPGEYHPQFAAAFSGGDIEALLALYEPTACLTVEPGNPVVGMDAMREVLQGFLALKPVFAITTRSILESADLALTVGDWTLSATGPDGGPIEMAGRSAEVLRKQADGTWLCAMDNAVADA